MSLRNGIPRSSLVTLSLIRPPSTRVWLLMRTPDASASRLMNEGEPVGGTPAPMSLTSCLTWSATVPRSPMRGVTVRITPASLYSTVWLVPPIVLVVVEPPAMTGLVVVVCWLVTIGTEVETLMTAFLFSDVSTWGFETMLTLFRDASVFRSTKNWPVLNVNAVRPWAAGPNRLAAPRNADAGRPSVVVDE